MAQKWDYTFWIHNAEQVEPKMLKAMLAEHGDQGWELAATMPVLRAVGDVGVQASASVSLSSAAG